MRKLVGPAVTTGTPLGAGASNESKYLRGNLPFGRQVKTKIAVESSGFASPIREVQ